MPFAGLGLHVLLAVLCAVHVVFSGQPLYGLFILFAFALLGSLVHGFMVCLPNARLERRALKAVSAAATAMHPGRAVREARAALEEAPTAQHKGFEALAGCAIWALSSGDLATAARLQERMDPITRRGNALNRELNAPVLRRLAAAQALARAQP